MTANATERGVNPFNPSHRGGMEAGVAMSDAPDPYDPRAKGVDGDMLDAMMKGRWQEGWQAGDADGRSAASQRYAPIYDDGFNAGFAAGAAEQSAQMASLLLPLLQQAGGTLAAIAGKTGSAAIKEVCKAQIAQIRDALDHHVGQHTEPQAGASV